MSFTAGEQLRLARDQKGFSIEDVAVRLKVPARYVTAIEQGDVAVLPEPMFVRGYVKTYARMVGIDAEELLASLAPVEVKAPKPLTSIEKSAGPAGGRRGGARAPKFRAAARRRHWIGGGVLAIVAAGWAAWLGYEDTMDMAGVRVVADTAAQVTPGAVAAVPAGDGTMTVEIPLPGAATPAASIATVGASAPPTVAPAAAAGTAPVVGVAGPDTTPAVAAPIVVPPLPRPVAVSRKGLHITFQATCWVEVRDGDNAVLHTGTALPDSELTIDGKPPLMLTLGDSSAAQVWYNGERMSLTRFTRAGVARIIVGQGAR
ncbi:MAG: RodZ domain-containing protein [Pseudomonadota bacterium]